MSAKRKSRCHATGSPTRNIAREQPRLKPERFIAGKFGPHPICAINAAVSHPEIHTFREKSQKSANVQVTGPCTKQSSASPWMRICVLTPLSRRDEGREICHQ